MHSIVRVVCDVTHHNRAADNRHHDGQSDESIDKCTKQEIGHNSQNYEITPARSFSTGS